MAVVLLGVLAVLFYRFAPWPLEYRMNGVKIMHDKLRKLPSFQDAQPDEVKDYYQDRILMTVQYPRNGTCADVFSHYRAVTSTEGWNFMSEDRAGTESLAYYTGAFSGYKVTLRLDCDTAEAVYFLDMYA